MDKYEVIEFTLIQPQMGENIGACARIMLNFGFTNLKLVNPRDGWPNEKAISMAAGASRVIDNTQIFTSTSEAVKNSHKIYATTKRERYMNKEVLSVNDFAKEIAENTALGLNSTILFGPERSGLTNEDISYAHKIVTFDVNPEYGSINLSQALGIIAYEISKNLSSKVIPTNKQELATAEDLNFFLKLLDQELENSHFYKIEEKKANMRINIRNIFHRIKDLSTQDVRTLISIIKSLKG